MLRQLFTLLLIAFLQNGLLSQGSDETESAEALCLKLMRYATIEPELFVEKVHPDSLKLFRELVLEFIESVPTEERNVVVKVLFDGTLDEKQVTSATAKHLYVSFLRKLWSATPPDMTEFMDKVELTIVGTIAEGEVSHVVVRTSVKDTEYRKLYIVSFKKHGNAWRALIAEELEFKIRTLIRKQKESNKAPN
ncbi:MAG: hypothetical protein WCK15_24540 [Pirellula sp.]